MSFVTHVSLHFLENGGVFRRRIPLGKLFEKTGPECRVHHCSGPLTPEERGRERWREGETYPPSGILFYSILFSAFFRLFLHYHSFVHALAIEMYNYISCQ